MSSGAVFGLLAAVFILGVWFTGFCLCRLAAMGDRALQARLPWEDED
jgi:hypothetical protein